MLKEQLNTIHEVASLYWHQDKERIHDELSAINVIKCTPGKVSGILPAYDSIPPIFFKVYFYDKGYQNEINGLAAAHSVENNSISVPRLVSVLPAHRAILVEKMTWRDSTSDFRKFFVRSLDINWRNIGTWLKSFHDSKIGEFEDDYYLNKKIKETGLVLTNIKHLFSPNQLKVIDAILDSYRQFFNDHKNECVLSHGDFGLDNIKFSESLAYIIDFEDLQMAPREFDILNLLTRLEYTGYFPNRPQLHKQICRDFFEGYNIQLSATPVYNFIYLMIKLKMIETYHRLMKKNSEQVHKKLIYYYFRQEGLKRLYQWLDHANVVYVHDAPGKFNNKVVYE